MNSSSPADLTGKQILLVHGWWGGPWVWDRFESYFSDRGATCRCIDLNRVPAARGNDSDLASFATHLQRLREVFLAMDRPFLVGHSAGGLLVLKLLEQVDAPAAALLGSAAPRGIFPLRSWELVRVATRYAGVLVRGRPFLPDRTDMDALNLNRMPEAERRWVYDRMIPVSGRQAFRLATIAVSVSPDRVKTPLLVINGEDDRLTPTSIARAIARRHGAIYRQYPGQGHYLMREPNWQTLAADIADWFVTFPCDDSRGTATSASAPTVSRSAPDPIHDSERSD